MKYKLSKFLLLFFLLGGVALVIFLTSPRKTTSKPQFSRSIFGHSYQAEIPHLNLNANLGIGQEGAKVAISRQDSQLEMTIPLSKATINKENEELVYRVPEEVVEVRYQLLDNGLKEDIILNKKPGNHEFSFELNAKNLTLKTTADSTPVFFDSRTGEYQFHFQKPFAKDAKGNVTYGVKYWLKEKPMPSNIVAPINVLGEKTENLSGRRELLGNPLPVPKSSNNRYILTATVDKEWLFNQERAFPVTIDPTVVHDTSSEFAEGSLDRITDTGSPNLETYYQELPVDIHTVGLWHMNNNWNDSSGNGNNGTTETAFTSNAVLGEYAGDFNGTSNKITISSVFGLANTNITIEAWVNLDSTSEDGAFVKIGDTNGYGIGVGATHMQTPGNNLILIFEGVRWIDTNRVIGTGWHHTAMTIDNAGVPEVFIDGISIGRFTGTSAASPTGSSYFGGYTVSGNDRYADCHIDEVRISNIARTSEEIEADAQRRPYGVYTSPVLDLNSTGVAAWNSLSWTEPGVATGDGETLAVGSTGNLVAQWNFNETSGATASNAAGSCGSTCNGSLTGFTNTTGQDVLVVSGWTADNKRWGGGALMFDGVDDYVRVTDNAALDVGSSFSAEVWVKTSNASTIIFRKTVAGAEDKNMQILATGKVGFYLYNTFGGASLSSNKIITDGQWHYLVGTYDGTTAKIYIDGVLDNSKAASGDVGDSTGDLFIGQISTGASYFKGVMDALRWYTRALSASEILANYNAGNIEFQTRVGDSADPNDGTWEAWMPTSDESQILSLDSDGVGWSWDNISYSVNFPKMKSDESVIKTEGNGSLELGFGGYETDSNTYQIFHLDETSGVFEDSGGQGVDGTGTGELAVVDGFYGRARYFDGADDYLDVQASYQPATNITIEAWVKPMAVNGANHTIVSKQRGTGTPNQPDGASWVLYGPDSSNVFRFSIYSGGWHHVTSTTVPKVGQWYHVAGSFDGSYLRIHVNGKLESAVSWTGSLSYSGPRPVKVGAGEVGVGMAAGEFYVGVIDEVRISGPTNARYAINIAESYRSGRDHRLWRTISSTDLSAKTRIPFWVAADRQGTFLEATIGESAFANYEPDVNTLGLWHLDDEAGVGNTGPNNASWIRDYTTNANNGTDYGGSTFTTGKIGKARDFDGSTDYIKTTTLGYPTNITVAAWIKADDTTTNQEIASQGRDFYCSGHNFRIASGGLAFLINTNAADDGCEGTASAAYPTDGGWHYVVGTYDGETVKLYIDGQLRAIDTAPSGNIVYKYSDVFNIGKLFYGEPTVWYPFNGKIDEVSVSNTARTADEIRQAYEVGQRTHPITIDFKAELNSGNLIANSSDSSFTIDSTQYGAQNMGGNLYAGDKIIVKEKVGTTEYLAQSTVTSVTPSTGAVTVDATVDAWDTGSTFPGSGYTVNATVFKWQREYFDVTGSLSTHRNAVTRITLRITDGSSGARIWLDDFRSLGNYLTNPTSSTITSSIGKRYFQYRAIFSSNDPPVSASLTTLTLDYEILNAPTGCLLEEHREDSQIIVKWNDTNAAETGYQIQKNTDAAGFVDLITKAADTTSHTDSAISSNHTYQYRIRAENSTISAYSDWCYTSGLNLGQGSFKFEGVRMEGVRID